MPRPKGFFTGRAYDAIMESKANRIDYASLAVHRAAQTARDRARYTSWEARGKPSSPSLPPRRKDRVHGIRQPQYQSMMERLIMAQSGKCFLCGEPVDVDTGLAQNDPLRASFDHVVPVSQGGPNERNRLAAHRDCNGHKADRMPYPCELIFLDAVNYFVDRVGPNVRVRATKEQTP